MTSKELDEIEQRIEQLPPGEQLELIEHLLRKLRLDYFTDHEALQRDLQKMAEDPGIQRELNLGGKAPKHAAG